MEKKKKRKYCTVFLNKEGVGIINNYNTET